MSGNSWRQATRRFRMHTHMHTQTNCTLQTAGRLPSRLRAAVPLAVLALFLGGVGQSFPAHAALYKWTDASGRVVYSDQPPNGDFKVETVNAPPPPSNPNALKELAAKEAESKKKKLESQEAAKKTDLERADAEKRLGVCRDAQAQMKQLAADQVALMTYNQKGEVVYMDDTERKRKRAELENWVRANCPG
jgi:hypothetical protein